MTSRRPRVLVPPLPRGEDDPLLAPLRILIGEPDLGTAQLLQRILEGRGYEVDTVGHGAGVVDLVDHGSYDVVVLAWTLVGASGLDVLREIRSRYALPDLPVVLMAPGGGSANLVRAFDRGANDFLHKPLEPDVTLVRIHNLVALRRARLELRQQAMIDALTGVFNRRFVMEVLGAQLAEARRYGRALSFCLCDIDHFKGVNDTHGHRAGDAALRTFAHLLRDEIRRSDVVARFGGDELCVVFPETSLHAAATVTERLREAVAATAVEVDGQRIAVTASFGVASLDGDDEISALVSRADAALYEAKLRGRNRTCTSDDVPRDSMITSLAI